MRGRANCSTAAPRLKQMQKIIEAQGPTVCRTDLGTLTADIAALHDGIVEAIDCLCLNRLARTAGAPIDKGAGIKLFKKIGDRVEKGEPLFRIHAFGEAEFDLAVAAATANSGYVVGSRAVRRRDRYCDEAGHPMSAGGGRSKPRGLAARLGIALHEIDVHRFPDGELRVTVGPAAPTTIIFTSLDQPNDKLLAILFAAEALRRGGATRLVLVAPYLCYMRQDAAFHPGEAISQRVIGRLIAQTVDRVITVDAHLHRTKNIADVFPGIEADDLSAMPAIADYLNADRLRSGNNRCRSRRRIGALGARSGAPPESRLRRRAKDPPWRPLGRDGVCRSGHVRRPPGAVGRRYRVVGRHASGLCQDACSGRRQVGRCRSSPMLCFRRN